MSAVTSNVASGRACSAPSCASGRHTSHRRPLLVASASGTDRSSIQAACSSDAAENGVASPLLRRQLLSAALLAPAAAALLGASAMPALAADDEAQGAAASGGFTYTDPDDKFSIKVPAGWVQGSGTIGQEGTLTSNQARFSNAAGLRKVVAFVPENNPAVSVAITIQFLAPDFTKMGSLGSALDFASSVVNRMDNSYILNLPEWRRAREGPVQVARLLDAREINGQYVFSYTLAKDGEPERTVYQAVAIGDTGRHHRLFTLNATCTAADKGKYAPVLEDMVKSFQAPPVTLV